MGLPGAGKTYLAERLQTHLKCAWYNADVIRGAANDWDFTPEGRQRQARRMRVFADFESNNERIVICDFVAPTEQARDAFDADVVIWMNTITEGRFEDTNKMFENPQFKDFEITHFMSDEDIANLADELEGWAIV